MALVLKDRVLETTTSTGTGTITLAGAVPGFQGFSAVGNGNTCYYTITDGVEWEVGVGTYTSSGTTLSRDSVLESSNSGNLVNFSAGTKNVFVTYPAESAVTLSDVQTLTNKTISMAGLLTQSAGADIVSASTVDLTTATGNCPKITGTTAVEAWTMNIGQQMKCIADGALPLTYDATTNNIEGGGNYTCSAGDIINLVKGLDGVVRVRIDRQGFTYPKIKPSLNLDFANTKSLDPRITFTNASNDRPYFDEFGVMRKAAANVPRFDHNPVTGESLGLLIEEQRANLLTYSEDISNAAWTKTSVTVTANAGIAPDGTQTADRLVEGTALAQSRWNANGIVVSGTVFTLSAYVKPDANRTGISLYPNSGGNGAICDFNLSTLTTSVTGMGTGTGTASIASVGNGWYRISITVTFASSITTLNNFMYFSNTPADGNATYNGDGVSGILFWGAQLEAGAFPTSYIKTEASQVTRAADSAVMTGTNFSSWYNATEGTLFANADTADVSSNRCSAQIFDGALNNRINLFASNSLKAFIAASGATQMSQGILSVVFTNNVASKVALAYSLNNGNAAANGTLGTLDTALTVPVVNQMRIGGISLSNSNINGHIRRAAYYPRRLSDSELQALTA